MTPDEVLTNARAALTAEERDRARTLLERVLETDPSNAEAWTLLVEAQKDSELRADTIERARAAGVVIAESSSSDTGAPTTHSRRRRSRRRQRRQLIFAGVLVLLLVFVLGSLAVFQRLRPNALAMLGPQPTATLWIPPTPEPTPVPTIELTSTFAPTPSPAPPIIFTGTGRAVVGPLKLSYAMNQVSLRHDDPTSRFTATAFGPNGEREALVSQEGAFQSNVPLREVYDGGYLKIEAEDPWTITIEGVPSDTAAAGGMSGDGNFLSGWYTPTQLGPVPYIVKHSGPGSITIRIYCTSGGETVDQITGDITAETVVNFRQGPCVWHIVGDGTWQLQPR